MGSCHLGILLSCWYNGYIRVYGMGRPEEGIKTTLCILDTRVYQTFGRGRPTQHTIQIIMV